MLSQSKLKEKQRIRELPPIDPPLTVRLKFKKVGSLQYISHLDLQRTFMRVVERACLPLWYTKGFNPHAKLVFSTPLSVGAQSVCEYLDVRIDRYMPCEEIKKRLNEELTEELCILDAYIPTRDFSEIAWATYDIEMCTANADGDMAKAAQALLTTSPLNMIKKTKSGEKEIDITRLIKEVSVKHDGELLKINCTLSASSTEYLNPEMLISALKANLGVMNGDATKEWYTIMRTALLKSDMKLFE